MSRIKFGDVVKDVKINIDRLNNPYEFYVAGDHMDSEDLTTHRKGRFATDDVGPAFIRVFKPGQILYGSRRTYLKKIAVADFEGICANTTFVLETKDPLVLEQRLLPFIMLSKDFTTWSIAKSKGSTNPYVLFSDLADFEFELPPLEEQKVLADKLWAAYRLKEAYKKLLVATDEMLKSQFIEMFGDSSVVRLEDKIATQSGGTPNTKKLKYYEGGNIPWLSSSEVNQGYIFSTEKFITQEGLDNSSARWIPKDSVLIAMYGATAGRVGLSTIPLTTNQAVCALLPCSSFNPIFLYYAVCQKTPWMISQCRGAAQPNISQGIIRSMELPIPPMAKQMQFVSIAKQADKSKFELRKSIDAIDKVIKSLINK